MSYQNGTHINLINKDYIMAQVRVGIGSLLSVNIGAVVYGQLNGTTLMRQSPSNKYKVFMDSLKCYKISNYQIIKLSTMHF